MTLFRRGRNTIAVVKIEGVVSESDAYGSGRAKIVRSLKEAERRGVRAIVLRVNTPGGTVGACQEIHAAIGRLKQTGIPIVASMGDIAASGGVYVSMAANEVIANPGTITGSIGVIIRGTDLSALYDKIGVAPKVVKSGAHKDMLATYRSLSAEEESLLQGLIDDSHRQFVEAVALGRKLPESEVAKIADGRILTGRQAKDLGLVDSLGDMQAAVDRAAHLAGMKARPKLVVIEPRKSLRQRLLRPFFGFVRAAGLPIELNPGATFALPPYRVPMWIMPDF